MSSKGRIVIPVVIRRRRGLKTGQALTIRTVTQDEIVLRPADRDSDAVDGTLRRLGKLLDLTTGWPQLRLKNSPAFVLPTESSSTRLGSADLEGDGPERCASTVDVL